MAFHKEILKMTLFLAMLRYSATELTWPLLTCDPVPMIKRHEGTRICMYLDTRQIKTIGVGFNLQDSGAKERVTAAGANYDKIVKGPATPPTQKCDCSKVVCLTTPQVDKLFQFSIKDADAVVAKSLSNFNSLCCNVQNALVDMAFNLGTKLSAFNVFFGFVKKSNWQAAGDDLTLTKYCADRDTSGRCMELAGYIRSGCPCSGSYPMKCSGKSVCCQSGVTCCPNIQHFMGYVTKDLPETWCCPFSGATCCPLKTFPKGECCPAGYPVCCPPPSDKCCPANYPVCRSDACYRSDGKAKIAGFPRHSIVNVDVEYNDIKWEFEAVGDTSGKTWNKLK